MPADLIKHVIISTHCLIFKLHVVVIVVFLQLMLLSLRLLLQQLLALVLFAVYAVAAYDVGICEYFAASV